MCVSDILFLIYCINSSLTAHQVNATYLLTTVVNFMFNGPCIITVKNCPTRCTNVQFIYICKLLYMFRAVSPPIIRSSYHCITVSGIIETVTGTCCVRDWMGTGSHPIMFIISSSNGLNNARYCRYCDMSS